MLDPRPGGIPNQEWVVVPDESDLPAAGNYDQPHVSIKARQRRDDLGRRTSLPVSGDCLGDPLSARSSLALELLGRILISAAWSNAIAYRHF